MFLKNPPNRQDIKSMCACVCAYQNIFPIVIGFLHLFHSSYYYFLFP